MAPLLACSVAILHSQRLQILLTSLQLSNTSVQNLNSVTPKKYRWNSFLENLTPIPARKLKMKQTYNLSEKVVVMELEQPSMNDVQQSIEEK